MRIITVVSVLVASVVACSQEDRSTVTSTQQFAETWHQRWLAAKPSDETAIGWGMVGETPVVVFCNNNNYVYIDAPMGANLEGWTKVSDLATAAFLVAPYERYETGLYLADRPADTGEKYRTSAELMAQVKVAAPTMFAGGKYKQQ